MTKRIAIVCAWGTLAVAACARVTTNGLPASAGGGSGNGSSGGSGGFVPGALDAGGFHDCVNLQCQQTKCMVTKCLVPACGELQNPDTTLSGTIYDPAG